MRPEQERRRGVRRGRASRLRSRRAVGLHADRRCRRPCRWSTSRRNIAPAAGKPHAALPAPDWWRGFRSRELTMLVERAQLANLDIAAAVARIVQADAQTRIAGAPLLPAIDFDGSAHALAAPARRPERATPTRRAQRELRDRLLGQEPRGAARRRDSAVASRFDREVVALTTVGSVTNAYFLVLAAQDRLRIARDNLDAATRVLERLSGALRRRHRLRPRHRAAGDAGRAAARRDPAARAAAAAEHRDARGADRRAAGAPDGARRQPVGDCARRA